MAEFLGTLKLVMEEYGLFAAIVVFFLARDFWREHRMVKTNEGLHKEMRDVLIPLVKTTTAALAESTARSEINDEALDNNSQVLVEVKTLLTKALQAT